MSLCLPPNPHPPTRTPTKQQQPRTTSAEKPPVRKTSDSRDRVDESLRYLLPQDSNVPYDMKHVVSKVRLSPCISRVTAGGLSWRTPSEQKGWDWPLFVGFVRRIVCFLGGWSGCKFQKSRPDADVAMLCDCSSQSEKFVRSWRSRRRDLPCLTDFDIMSSSLDSNQHQER